MSERAKTICVLIGAQVLCLLSGMVIFERLISTTMKFSGRERIWAELDTGSEFIIDQAASENITQEQAEAWLTEAGIDTSTTKILLLDATNIKSLETAGWQTVAKSKPQERIPSKRGILSGTDFAVLRAIPNEKKQKLVVQRGRHHLPDFAKEARQPILIGCIVTFIWSVGLLGIVSHLVVAPIFERFADRQAEANRAALKQAESMERMRDAVIFGLVKLTESRDPETGNHLERIAQFSSRLSVAMSRHPEFRGIITPEFVRLIELSSILHDIGKVGVEDAILLKPGRLTPEERSRMQQHAVIGGQCLEDIEQRLGTSNFLEMAREIAFYHHERWDGAGYPSGLAGEAIPLSARIVAVCDVYEALGTKRVYKDALPHEECVAYLREQAGQHFDPKIVEIFMEIEPQIKATMEQYADDKLDERPGKSVTEKAMAELASSVEVPVTSI